MSEKIEKSPEEQLADVVKSTVDVAVEAKADKADLEGFAKSADIPSLEGLVKSEELEAAKSELEAVKSELAEVKSVVNSAPAIIKGDKMTEEKKGFNWVDVNGIKSAEVDISKSYNVTTQVAGEPTASASVYHNMVQANIFRSVSTIMPIGSSTVQLPEVTSITAAHEANIPATINTGSGHGGDVATKSLVAQNWTARTVFSKSSVEDLTDLDPMVASFIGQQIGEAEAQDQVAQLKAAVNAGSGNIARVGSAQSGNAFPTNVNPWAAVMSSLSSAYKPNAKWMMSREALESLRTILQGGTGSPLVINPSDGNFMLWGYEIMINDYFESDGTANNLLALFGDFRRGTIIGSRKSMSVERNDYTIPGGVYYYGNQRSRGMDWDRNALVALRATIS